MATGLLTLGVGSSTRLLTYLVGLDKQYTATIRLGSSTHTDDREGDIVFIAESSDIQGITDSDIDSVIHSLTGAISQRPSSVSAIKIEGKRAHELVREGQDVVIPEREVTVSRFDVLNRTRSDGFIDLDVIVDCSSGTYIRALARDLGDALHVGGHLTALRRTRVGPFDVNEALDASSIVETTLHSPAEIAGRLFPLVTVDAQQAMDIVHGKKIVLDIPDSPLVAVCAPDGVLIALVAFRKGIGRVEIGFPRD